MIDATNILWVDKYKPHSVDDFVWVNQNQRQQVEKWIESKSPAHLLLSGEAGVGKCLHYDELITVRGIDSTNSEKVIAIGKLFELMGASDSPYEEVYPVSHSGIEIKTPDGYAPILGLVRKHTHVSEYGFDNHTSLKCADKHLVFEKGTCKKISECQTIDTIEGNLEIVSRKELGVMDVYDVSIPYPHVYVTPNGIKHHNTALANLLIELCDINPYDTLIINASRENSVDTVREKIIGHVETAPLGHLKVVLLDEADSLSIQAQKALRSDIETYQATCRFILTCNYPEKIIPALKSRCYEMYINKTDQVEYTTRAAKVLLAEGIEFDIETLDLYVSTCYPDLRKCLHALQINSSTGKLLVPDETTESEDSQLIQITHLLKSGKVFEGRQALLAFLAKYPTKIENIYRWMYSNLKLWGNNTDQLDSAILIIRDGLAQLPLVGIAEISLSATLIELSRNMQD